MEGISRSYRISGGVLGLLSVALTIPAYIVATPDTQSTPTQAEAFPAFLLANGTLMLLHVIALLLFVAVLAAALGQGGAAGAAPRFAVLGGGIAFATLSAVGVSVEILAPAALQRFPDAVIDPAHPLALALWIYGFSLAAAVVMLIGAAVASFGGRLLSAWFGWVSLLIAVVALARPLIGPYAAYAVLLWVALASLLLILQKDRAADA